MDRHAAREIEIFRRFAGAAGLEVDEDSIEKRDPPEPDILCQRDGQELAFELVEIIDQSHAQRVWGQLKLKSKFEARYQMLDASRRENIQIRAGDALVHVVFEDAATFNEREQAVDSVFETLETLDPEFEGQLRRSDAPALSAAIQVVRVSRVDAEGPFFDVDAVGSLGDPTVDVIRGKFTKTYTTSHPIELLAYCELQPDVPGVLWRPSLEQFLAGSSSKRFRRVWVYDCASDRIRFSSPLYGNDNPESDNGLPPTPAL